MKDQLHIATTAYSTFTEYKTLCAHGTNNQKTIFSQFSYNIREDLFTADHVWCQDCVDHPSLPLLVLAETEL